MKLSLLALVAATGVVITVHPKTPGRTHTGSFASSQLSGYWPQPAPKLIGGPDDWLNTDGKPLQIKKGTVYLLDFFEYTCVNCQRTLPYLKEWNRRYAKDGLVIIGIHTPEFKFAKDPRNVAEAIKRLGITWPVLIDSDYRNWLTYQGQNGVWPRKYFINARGNIVSDHAGEGSYATNELRIQEMLKQAHPDLRFPKLMEPVRDTDKPGAVCYRTTPELYAGERGAHEGMHGNIDSYVKGGKATLIDPGAHEDDKIYLQGVWRTEEESLRHGRATDNIDDYLALRYHALGCNAVIKPEGGKPFRVYVTQNGKPVAKEDKGEDIQYDDKGGSYILVDTPRMYRLTLNARFDTYELRMASTSPDFALYSFTFESCEMR